MPHGPLWRSAETGLVVALYRVRHPLKAKPDLPAHAQAACLSVDYLESAVTEAGKHELGDLAAIFGDTLSDLDWSQNKDYLEQNINTDFLAGYAYAVLSGPAGPIVREAPLSGFILLGQGLYYPGYQHPAREIYLPLTPGARWRLEDGEWFDVNVGDLILHDQWVIHATKTGDLPFLAFVAWLDPADRDLIKWADAD